MNRFVGLGAQRAGTTWLWRVLQRHPDVAFSPIKELHYFSVKHGIEGHAEHHDLVRKQLLHHIDRYDPQAPQARSRVRLRMLAHWLTMKDDADYLEYLERIAEYSGKRCVGEITPLYALLPVEGWKDLLQVVPDARLFFVMRNPVERIWSNARMHGKPPADLLRFCERPAVRARTDYRATLEGLLSVVPRARVHVAFYEDLCDREDGPAHLNALFEHLGISSFQVPEEVNRNRDGAGPSAALAPSLRREIVKRFAPSYEFAREFMGRLPRKWEQDFAQG